MFKTKNLYQNDERWKEARLGDSDETIGGWGCLLTSVTMMLNGLGYDETPLTVNDKMKAVGGFQGAFRQAFKPIMFWSRKGLVMIILSMTHTGIPGTALRSQFC